MSLSRSIRLSEDAAFEDPQTAIETVCKSRGWLISGGRPDTDRGSAVILDEFRAGKLGRITLQSAPKKQEKPQAAVSKETKE